MLCYDLHQYYCECTELHTNTFFPLLIDFFMLALEKDISLIA